MRLAWKSQNKLFSIECLKPAVRLLSTIFALICNTIVYLGYEFCLLIIGPQIICRLLWVIGVLEFNLWNRNYYLGNVSFPWPWFCFLIKSIAMEPKQVQKTRRGICETFKISLAFISFIQVFYNYEAYCTLCFCGKLWESITMFQRKKCTPHFRNFKEHLSFDKW